MPPNSSVWRRIPALSRRAQSSLSSGPSPRMASSKPSTGSRSSRQKPWLQALIATKALAARRSSTVAAGDRTAHRCVAGRRARAPAGRGRPRRAARRSRARRARCARPGCNQPRRASAMVGDELAVQHHVAVEEHDVVAAVAAIATLRRRPAGIPRAAARRDARSSAPAARNPDDLDRRRARAVVGDDRPRRASGCAMTLASTASASGRSKVVTTRQQRVAARPRRDAAPPAARPTATRSRRPPAARMSPTSAAHAARPRVLLQPALQRARRGRGPGSRRAPAA